MSESTPSPRKRHPNSKILFRRRNRANPRHGTITIRISEDESLQLDALAYSLNLDSQADVIREAIRYWIDNELYISRLVKISPPSGHNPLHYERTKRPKIALGRARAAMERARAASEGSQAKSKE